MSKILNAGSMIVALSIVGAAVAQERGPSSSADPYVLPTKAGVKTVSILTVGDSVNNKPDGSPYRMVGIPDGLGAYNLDGNTFSLLSTHELGGNVGITRAHGGTGAFVSQWTIDRSTLKVSNGQDLITGMTVYDRGSKSFRAGTGSELNVNRFCSADLANGAAFYNPSSGLGTQARLFTGGEEAGAEGRAFATIATGANAGQTHELAWLGKYSWENAVPRPFASDRTVVAGLDDNSTQGQVYFYVGDKTNSGNEIDRAGLNNGTKYGLRVANAPTDGSGFSYEDNTKGINGAKQPFELVNLGDVSQLTGAELNKKSNETGVTYWQRPEDGTWDPNNPNDFYYVTTASATSNSRLWRARFKDSEHPEQGGEIEMLLDGSEGHKMLDNITIDRYGNLLMQEDVGNNDRLGAIWMYDSNTDSLEKIAEHDSKLFTVGEQNFLTRDEESSGIIDAWDILGPGWFLLDVQAHYNIGDSELVEGGQYIAMYVPEPASILLIAGIALFIRRR